MEAGGSSQKIKAKKICFNGLIDHLFSWSLEDVLYDDFYKDKVQKIPESFKSVHQYLGSYLFPLLEETRAELSLSLKAIRRAPFAQLVTVEEPKSSGKLLINVNVDSWRNSTNNSGKEPYRTLPGDIFLILDDKPETIMNLQCSTRTWAFAWLNQITDNRCSTHLKLNVSKNIRGEHGTQKYFFIIFLMNVTTNLRIWNSLHCSRDVKIIEHVLGKNSMGDEICNKCSLYNNAVCAEKLGTSLSSVLNDSQKAVVLCSVCRTLCDHKPSVELIWGPPGTGKTKTISFLLWAILELRQRILACAPTNVAITELASRVVKLLREASRAGGVLCSLGDMLLFGNKDRLKVGSELEEIYSDYRVDRLVECFGQSGWKYHTTSLIKLLESGNSEYHMLLESNVNMSFRRDKKTGDNEAEVTSFLGFIREKFKSSALALRGCLQTLITHIPKQFILEHNFQNIEALLHLTDSFGMLLSRDNVTSVQMEILFSSPEVFMGFPNSSVEATFLYLRSQCLSILRTLQASLDQLQLPSTANKKSVRKFCFQRASLILCTASSSFQLNSMKMDPVNLLVIDEAAQLKECESIVPLQLPGIKHAILIGDECQLPAIVSSQVCDAAGYGRSLFERLSLLGYSKHLLNTQYRMHPSISCFPNSKFYSNQILDAPLVMDKVHNKHYIPSPMFGPYTFINVSVGKEEGDDDGHSKKNKVEVAVVIKIIEKLYTAWRSAKTRLSIGVISFYAAQVSAIQSRLGHKYEKSDKFTVKVKSVDGFQGGEEDVIILSTVRSNRRKNIGFISNSQRINVALTRARHCLWIVGDATTLGNSNSEWEAVVSNAKDRQCYFNAEEDKDLADAIIEVKKVLLELDDLLNKDSILFKMAQWKVLLSDSFRASFQKVASINQKKSIIVILLRLSCGWRPETDYISNPKCSNIIKCVKVEGLFIIYSLDIEKDSKYKQILKIWDIKPWTDVKVLVDCLSNIHELYTDDFLNLCKEKSHKGDLDFAQQGRFPSSSDYWEYIFFSNAIGITRFFHTYIYLTKCGEAKFEDAGDCYMLAECYKLAAEAYSRGRCFLKFLNVCTVANLFDMGLQVICSWRKYDDVDLIEKCQDIKEIWHVFLEKGALHYHQLQDFCSMIKFVETFDSMDEKYSFLRTLGLSEKKLLLEKDVKEATNIMMKTGGIIIEIDRLEKAGNFKDASSLILLYVLFNSLWGCAKKGWPLKLFKRKEKLLTRAKSLAMNESDSFYDYVTTEANILSNKTRKLSEMEQNWSSSHMQGNLRGEILSAWRILDAHLSSSASTYIRENKTLTNLREHVGQTISLNWVSVQTLVYFWNFWKENVSSILKYLQLPESQINSDYASYEQFCLDFLGVRKQLNYGNSIYHLLDPEVEWARAVSFEGNENFVTINSREFVAAAQSYWFSEISSVGLKVLSKLKDLHMLPVKSSDSSYFQVFTAVHTFEMAKFLTEDDYIKSSIDHKNLRLVFELGLLSIQFLRMNQTPNIDLANEIQAVHENSQSYLMSCALHFHKIQDSSTMLKFVRDFCSMDSKRSFLKSFNYFNELLSLEMEARNFSEALAIAVSQGNLLLEVDLLEKTGNYKEASLLLIFYIYANSLWTSGSKGWPIKEFEHKKKLLEKTMSIAKCDSEAFYDMISVEANILSCKVSALDEMEQSLTASEGHKNYRGIILSAWKILDAHLKLDVSNYMWENVREDDLERHSKETISKNQVSFETLVYFWNLWKDSLIGVLDYLCSIDIEDVNGYCESQQDFCLSHFGVRRQYNNQETLYFLLNPDAVWATEVANGSLHRNGGLIGIAACQFTSAGWRYWCSEVLSVGMKVLEKLKALYSFSASASNSSELCPSMVAINFCEVENFLKNSQFLKCATETLLQNFTNVRLQFVLCCKQHLGQGSLVGNIHELEDLKFTFLRKCAVHYHRLQDKRTMMKFVEAFHSIDSKRLFLKSLGCLDELLSLEEISGNFIEAAAIARLKGDLLLEVDLLEKAGQLEEAVELILFYVLASSLWTTQNKGWPLKQFKRKEELLLKAKSIAKLNSDVFHRNVCIETEILSDGIYSLLDMKHHLGSSLEHKNICGEILSARRILDAHLCSNTLSYDWEDEIVSNPLIHAENKISQSKVSIETLSHFWNLWKDYILGTIKYLESLGTKNVNDFIIYEGFCLKYLGMRKQFDHQNTYQLLFPDADWITHISLQSVQTNGKLMRMDVEQFTLAARSYWSTELLSVGMKVLECLSNIHGFSVRHSLSKFRQSSAAIHIFEIANFLISSNLAKLLDDDKKLRDYLESYADHFIDNVFGLCWTDPMTENMITLRETGLSRSVTEAVILKTINSKGQLSYEKIGKVVMALLGSGKLPSGLYDKIARGCNVKLHWKSVIDAFKRHMIASQTSESSVAGKVDEASGGGDLINQLHEALMLTFVNWKKEFDYMSPNCFLYIVERQFVLISMSQRCFYTTRSSFIEWLVHEEWSGRQGHSMVNTEISSEHLFDSIAKMVHELLFNNCGAREWIKRSNINSKKYYPIFLLRLVIIMCLLSANLGKYYNMLYDFIRKPDMHSQLPKAFSTLFKQRKKQNLHFLNSMAEAVWKIGNPLVKVCFKGVCKKPVAPATISIRMKKIGRKDDIWKLLFAKNLMDDHNCGSFSPSGSKKDEPSSGGSTLLNSKTSQVLHSANQDDSRDAVAITFKQNLNKMSDSMKSEKHTHMINPKSSKSNALTKMKLKKKVHYINASMPKSRKKGSFDRETELVQVKSILDELKMSPALDMRDPELATTLEELSRKLECRQEKNTSNVVRNTSQSTKLSSSSRRKRRTRERKGKENDKMSVDNKIPTAKVSSQGLKFQHKFELETSSPAKTKDDKKITAKGSSQGLQFQPKLESVHKETTSQNDTKTNNKMKVTDNMSTAKGSPQGLKFQPKLELLCKETSQNGTKSENKMKVAHTMSTAKGSSQGLQFQPKLESKRVSQNDTKKNDNMKVADNMSTAKGSSQELQFQPKHESLCKDKASQNDSRTGDKMKVAHVMSTAKNSSHKLQSKPKLVSAKKEIAVKNDVKTEKDTMNIANNKAESAQKLQCKQKLKYVQKETSMSDSKVKKDTMKDSVNLSEAKEPSPSQQLQIEQKRLKQKDLKAEKGEQKVADHKSIS